MSRRIDIVATCLLAAVALTPLQTAHAESLAEIFAAANQAYFGSDYGGAAQRYQRLVDAGVRDADVYFNLGVTKARLGELGAAVLHFERAALLAPSDADIDTALTTARTALGKRRSERQGEATVQTRRPLTEALVKPYRENTLAVLTLVFDVLLFALLLARARVHGELLRTGLAIAAVASALALIASGAALGIKRGGLAEGTAAVVLREDAALRDGPDPRAQTRSLAHEGQSARTLQREGSFLRVRTADGHEGWMHTGDVGVVSAD